MLNSVGFKHGRYGIASETVSQPTDTLYVLDCFPVETNKETRGARIARLRKGRKLTQLQLAELIGVTKAAVSKWEATDYPDIALDTFFQLAREFGIDPQELATGESAKSKATVDIPQRRLDLIRKYGTLPQELRLTIRALIESLTAAQSERYATWSKEVGEQARTRDRKKTDLA